MIEDTLTNDEMSRFWAWFARVFLDPEWFDPAFYCGLTFATGARRCELTALRVEDCRVHGHIYVITRTAKGYRTGPRTRQMDVLPHFHPYYLDHMQRLRADGREWVFPSRLHPNQPIARRTATAWWAHCLSAAGLEHRGTHCGRRTFGTYATRIPFKLRDGTTAYMQPIALRNQLGHKKFDVTLSYYHQDEPGTRFPGQEPVTWHEDLEQSINRDLLLIPKKQEDT